MFWRASTADDQIRDTHCIVMLAVVCGADPSCWNSWDTSTYSQHQDGTRGSTTNSLIGWSAGEANQSGLHIHPIWPPPSIFISGGCKQNVYENNQRPIVQLEVAFTGKIRATPKEEEYVRRIDHFARRIQTCHQRKGGHWEHVLWIMHPLR